MTEAVLNTIGLLATIVGTGLLWKYGLAPDVDPLGRQFIMVSNPDLSEIAKGKVYIRNGRIGIALIGLGAAFQLAAIWI